MFFVEVVHQMNNHTHHHHQPFSKAVTTIEASEAIASLKIP